MKAKFVDAVDPLDLSDRFELGGRFKLQPIFLILHDDEIVIFFN